ncbi:hypothetical protein [Streptomyces sp. NPDC001833]|uniref:hypothetical protein n=1 Tax=Streptomyces sp. NPDC001833 TaxID=3154658 RepID=UPI003319619E
MISRPSHQGQPEQPAKELEAVRADREELVGTQRVLIRLNAQAEADETSGPATGQVASRAVLLVPHQEKDMAETTHRPFRRTKRDWLHRALCDVGLWR